MAGKKVWYIAGILKRAEEPFHEKCMLPALLEGPVYRLTESGVSFQSTLRGCNHCKEWYTIEKDGTVMKAKFNLKGANE